MARVTRLEKRDGKVGLRLGGGAPCYPLVFVAEVIAGSPADQDGSLTGGDEILSINNENLNGSGRAYAVRLIQQSRVRQGCIEHSANVVPLLAGVSERHQCDNSARLAPRPSILVCISRSAGLGSAVSLYFWLGLACLANVY